VDKTNMSEFLTMRYEDARWCEQQDLDGHLHGAWTASNGQKEWERQQAEGRNVGFT
jgi:hypothetical protein